jgi:hypothetical protein
MKDKATDLLPECHPTTSKFKKRITFFDFLMSVANIAASAQKKLYCENNTTRS